MGRVLVIVCLFILTTAFFPSLFFTVNESRAEETYAGVIPKQHACTFSYTDQIENRSVPACYPMIGRVLTTFGGNPPISSNQNVTYDSVNSSVTMQELNSSKVWKSKVSSPSIPIDKYDNVAEPSFASNGTFVFYAGNHFAARSIMGNDWEYVDPSFDFKGVTVANSTASNFSSSTGSNFTSEPIFKADQHVEYDPVRSMYIWVRQGEQVLLGGSKSNIDRLAISRDLDRWVSYDLVSIDVLSKPRINRAVFDYPDIVVTDKFLYLTTSVYSLNAIYGLIIRISLDDLSNSLDQPAGSLPAINYQYVLDREVETVTPVDGSSDPMYFGSHLPNNSTSMKIYSWFDDSPTLNSREVVIKPWNNIKNGEICKDPSNSKAWWCIANTSSRIRSAWMSQNSINFVWNAVLSHDGGTSWLPYMDSATFYVDECLRYERKYHLADQGTPWMFGAVSPDKQGHLGVGALYVDTRYSNSQSSPYINYAFGVFNNTEEKWEMMPILNSTVPLPVRDEEGKTDYNIGDFLTTKAHVGVNNTYSWDAGGYVIVGSNYNNTEPYYLMIKD